MPPPSPANLKKWRRKSVQMITDLIESAAFSHNVTKGRHATHGAIGSPIIASRALFNLSVVDARSDRLALVDLAGSEDVGRSGATGQALAEAKKINTSLLALGSVIHALTEGKTGHVPFRNSVLTRLLQESFGGNCKTTLLCCISPAAQDVTETLSTLRFGGRAKRVRNFAHINATVDVNALAEELHARPVTIRPATAPCEQRRLVAALLPC